MNSDKQEFRNAMALLGSAVNVIATDGVGGRCGYTGTAACSVTDEPATILVCLNTNSAMNKVFKENGVLSVNVLSGEQLEMSGRFAGSDGTPMNKRFMGAEWITLRTGSPINRESLCALDCTISSVQHFGTHTVFFCAVRDIHFGQADNGLVYWARSFHKLERPDAAP